jgi:hypothetical protein
MLIEWTFPFINMFMAALALIGSVEVLVFASNVAIHGNEIDIANSASSISLVRFESGIRVRRLWYEINEE